MEKITSLERSQIYPLLFSLKRKGWVKEVEKGKYVTTVFGTIETSIFSIATNLTWPSYISFWSALNYYGFKEQAPKTITVATTKKKKEVKFEDVTIKFITLSPKRFFGYIRLEDFTIAEKEKCIIDSLLLPRYSGGINEISKAIHLAIEDIMLEKLVDYAIKIGNKSVVKRLGYILKKLNIEIPKDLEKRMKKNIGKGFSLLDPSKPKTNIYDREWLLIINIPEEKLQEWREIH